ncbi:MAG: signal recognition particle receptor subunit alpha, partial [Actinobacteria bacterium]|nr:signal recognition particle receptor subunit alpha [Actinomycetota bacterium]
MFETLSSRLGGVLKGLRNRGRLTEQDVTQVLAEVRTALLEADVNVTVVRDVVERIRTQAVGATSSTAL